jgi:hypothetical protein
VSPTHSEGLAAAKRVIAANEHGAHPDPLDAIVMHTYQISLELRLLPQEARVEAAREVARRIVRNTGESLG